MASATSCILATMTGTATSATSIPVSAGGRVIYPQGKQAPAGAKLPGQRQRLRSGRRQRHQLGHGQRCAVHAGAGQQHSGLPIGPQEVSRTSASCRASALPIGRSATTSGLFAAAFGIYNINMLGSSFYSLTGTVQAYTQQFKNTYNPATHAIGYQWPQIYAGRRQAGCTTCYGTDYFGTANSTNWKDPYTEQWSLSVDHDFGSGYAARISYIGSETHQLVWAPDENTLPFSTTVSAYNAPISARLFPNWGRINTRATGANASYNSFQVEASHRLQHGLEYHSVLTWAKAPGGQPGTGAKPDLRERAAAAAPPRSWIAMWTSAMSTERGA